MMENKNTRLGIINEVGDLGFGFTEITEQEQETIRKNEELKKKEKEENK